MLLLKVCEFAGRMSRFGLEGSPADTPETRTMDPNRPLREHLTKLLDWRDAHADFDAAVKDMPFELAGDRPGGLPYSPWELLEHLRLAQRDILDFCRDPKYAEKKWPDDYWPDDPAPPTPTAWTESVAAF